jgi:hypothetical protein
MLTLHNRRHHFDALFLINVARIATYCPSVLETVGIRVPARNIRNFNFLASSSNHCPSSRCVSAAVCKRTDIFSNSCLSANDFSGSVFLLLCRPVLSRCYCLYSC